MKLKKLNRFWNRILNRFIPNRRARLLSEIVKMDQELGLYDETMKTKEK